MAKFLKVYQSTERYPGSGRLSSVTYVVLALINASKRKVRQDSFITSLYSLSEHCGYGVLREVMIREICHRDPGHRSFTETPVDGKVDIGSGPHQGTRGPSY